MEKTKRRFGDRKDGVWLKDIDSMHRMAPYILRKRADREAFIEELIDLTPINEYLARKNAQNPEFKYTIFQVICTAIVKTVTLRPKMNRFIAGRRVYQRNYLSVGFVANKKFSDSSGESMMMLYMDEDNTMDHFNDVMCRKVNGVRLEGKTDNSTNVMDKLTRMPRPLLAVVSWLLYALDYFGRVPYDIIKEEPNYSSIFLTNLGSIKLNADYHHLNNWGTNSLFVVIGEKKIRPFFDDQGNMEMKDSLKISITLDELIADGYYYSKTIKLLKYLLAHPDLLDLPANEEVNYDN